MLWRLNSRLTQKGHHHGILLRNPDQVWSGTYHKGCREAEVALNGLHDIRHPDEWNNLADDMQWDDWPWLIEKHPTVAARMGITIEQHDEIASRYSPPPTGVTQ